MGIDKFKCSQLASANDNAPFVRTLELLVRYCFVRSTVFTNLPFSYHISR